MARGAIQSPEDLHDEKERWPEGLRGREGGGMAVLQEASAVT